MKERIVLERNTCYLMKLNVSLMATSVTQVPRFVVRFYFSFHFFSMRGYLAIYNSS